MGMKASPIEHPTALFAYIGDEIESSFSNAGIRLKLLLDFTNSSASTLRWERAVTRLAAERSDDNGNVEVLAVASLISPRSNEELMSQLAPFIKSIKDALARRSLDSNEPPLK